MNIQKGDITGSVGFKDALLGNQHWLEGTQLVVISNTQWVGETMPCLTYGMRGMIALSIEVRSCHIMPAGLLES